MLCIDVGKHEQKVTATDVHYTDKHNGLTRFSWLHNNFWFSLAIANQRITLDALGTLSSMTSKAQSPPCMTIVYATQPRDYHTGTATLILVVP